MKEPLLKRSDELKVNNEYTLADAINSEAKGQIDKLDYLGHKFAYDEYNQNPDLVQENKFGYKVFFTRDQDLLNEYYEIRVNAYRTRLGFEKFNKLETDFDKEGKILLVTKDGKVVGGMRLMFSDECRYFSAEHPGTQFQYEKVVRRYHDNRQVITGMEISGIAALEEGRNFLVLELLLDFASSYAVSRGYNYIYGIALLVACRLYRVIAEKLGFYLEIVLSHPWEKKEVFNFLPTFPIYVKLK